MHGDAGSQLIHYEDEGTAGTRHHIAQQRPPLDTSNVSPALHQRIQSPFCSGTPLCHHCLQRVQENSNQAFRHLIQAPWREGEKRGQFPDCPVKYLPDSSDLFVAELTAPSSDILSWLKSCTCSRWHWLLGSAAQWEKWYYPHTEQPPSIKTALSCDRDTGQLNQSFAQNLSFLQYISRNKHASVHINFSVCHLLYSFHLMKTNAQSQGCCAHKEPVVEDAGPLDYQPSAGPVGLRSSTELSTGI